MDTVTIALEKENNRFSEMDAKEAEALYCPLWDNPALTPEQIDEMLPF